MKKKNGFTLVEIVIVIALLGLMMLLVVTNVVDRVANAKKNMFYNDVVNLFSNATSNYITRLSEGGVIPNYFCHGSNACETNNEVRMDVDSSENLQYFISVDNTGHILYIYVQNEDFAYEQGDHMNPYIINKSDLSKNNVHSFNDNYYYGGGGPGVSVEIQS